MFRRGRHNHQHIPPARCHLHPSPSAAASKLHDAITRSSCVKTFSECAGHRPVVSRSWSTMITPACASLSHTCSWHCSLDSRPSTLLQTTSECHPPDSRAAFNSERHLEAYAFSVCGNDDPHAGVRCVLKCRVRKLQCVLMDVLPSWAAYFFVCAIQSLCLLQSCLCNRG